MRGNWRSPALCEELQDDPPPGALGAVDVLRGTLQPPRQIAEAGRADLDAGPAPARQGYRIRARQALVVISGSSGWSARNGIKYARDSNKK